MIRTAYLWINLVKGDVKLWKVLCIFFQLLIICGGRIRSLLAWTSLVNSSKGRAALMTITLIRKYPDNNIMTSMIRAYFGCLGEGRVSIIKPVFVIPLQSLEEAGINVGLLASASLLDVLHQRVDV